MTRRYLDLLEAEHVKLSNEIETLTIDPKDPRGIALETLINQNRQAIQKARALDNKTWQQLINSQPGNRGDESPKPDILSQIEATNDRIRRLLEASRLESSRNIPQEIAGQMFAAAAE